MKTTEIYIACSNLEADSTITLYENGVDYVSRENGVPFTYGLEMSAKVEELLEREVFTFRLESDNTLSVQLM